jgi:hypothetical protein
MKNNKYTWVLGSAITLSIIIIPLLVFVPDRTPPRDDPQAQLPPVKQHTSHADLLPGPYQTGQEVTAACRTCHPQAAEQVNHTSHFRWESDPVYSRST